MNLDAIFRAANENTDPDPSERDFEELMANALRVCLDDLLANRGPLTDEQRKAMFARMGGGRGATRSWDAPTGDVKKITQSIGNRSPTTLLETAVRVARTPDAVLANARRPVVPGQEQAPKPTPGEGPERPVVPGTDQQPKPVKPAPKPPKMPQITPAMLERLRKRIAGE